MKTISTLIIALVNISFMICQELKNVDFISPFHEDLAAVQNGDRWAFIDNEGSIVIDYRSDLVAMPCDEHPLWSFPKFVNGRALIQEEKDNIMYYGFIDTTGQTIVSPSFINTPHYNEDGLVIVQKLHKESFGSNDLINKNVVRYTYTEEVLDHNGKTVGYLSEPKHILPYKDKMKKAPALSAILLSEDWVSTQNKNKTYDLIRLKTNQNK